MFQYIQFIIFIVILGTFIYQQKHNIIDKFSDVLPKSISNFTSNLTSNFNLKNNVESFKNGVGLGVSNLFSLEKPKILTSQINISTEGIPRIANDYESDFNNEIVKYLQNFISLVQLPDPNDIISNLYEVNNINSKKVDLMLVQEETFLDAYTGKGQFKKPLTNLRFIAGLNYETFVLLTYPESGINSWKDIKGKIIGFPNKKTGSFLNGTKIAHAYGFDAEKDFRYINVDSMNRLANLFFERQIDAIYLTTSNKNPYLKNLAKKMSLKFIGTNDIDENIMKTYFPCSAEKYINTNNFYTNINTASFIKTYATRTVLITNKEMDPDYIYNLTKTLYQKCEELKLLVNNYLYNKDKLNLVRDAFIPSQMSYINDQISYHSGSQKYYDEIYKENYQNII